MALEGCLVVVVELGSPRVPGAVGYVLERPSRRDRRCDVVGRGTCVVVLTRRPSEACEYRLRAVDADGRRSAASDPFCIARVDLE